jgi:DNA helicase II / ATP-dependent DNA helicase PcrA
LNFTDFTEKYNIQLNEQQLRAVRAVDGPVLLLAVPGSGKTTVLVSRLGYMIYCLGIRPESILTVTYTVAATEDMRRRFAKIFGEEDAKRLEFRTINGISQKVLQYFAYRTQKTPFQVADKEASTAVKQSFLEVTGKYATENDIKETQLEITYAKNMRLTPEEIRDMDTEVEKFPEIFQTYNAKLRQMQMIDYDDQMIYALRILEQYPEVLAYFREKYQYFCSRSSQGKILRAVSIHDSIVISHSHRFFCRLAVRYFLCIVLPPQDISDVRRIVGLCITMTARTDCLLPGRHLCPHRQQFVRNQTDSCLR